MEHTRQILVRSLKEHSRLSNEDIAQISGIRHDIRRLEPDADFMHQGDSPEVSALVVSGLVGRYQLLVDGRRQYLSFHMTGDLPDAQTIFINEADHGLCTIGAATVAFIPHRELVSAFCRRPAFAFAVWRETLIDAAILREAITNNSARTMVARMAHLFCELFYRARQSGLNHGTKLDLPINRTQLGEALGMAVATVDRTLLELRTSNAMDFRSGKLTVKHWTRLV